MAHTHSICQADARDQALFVPYLTSGLERNLSLGSMSADYVARGALQVHVLAMGHAQGTMIPRAP